MTRMLTLFALLTATVACGQPTDSGELVVDPGLQGREVPTVAMHMSIQDADGPVLGAMVCSETACATAPHGEVTLHLPAGTPSEVQIIDWSHAPTVVHWEAAEADGALTIELLTEPEVARRMAAAHRATHDGELRRPGHLATWDGELHSIVQSDEPASVELDADSAGEMVVVRFDG